MKYLFALAAIPVALLSAHNASLLERHAENLTKAASVSVKLRATTIGGGIEDQTLILSRDNRLRWENPRSIIISDGKQVMTLNRAKKSYTLTEWSAGWQKSILSTDTIYAWSAFLDSKFLEQSGAGKVGAERTSKGISTVDVTISKPGGGLFTLLIDTSGGIARGAAFKDKAGSDVIVQGEVKLGDKPADAEKFALNPPDGYALATEDAGAKLKYADIQAIITDRCVKCHGEVDPKDGLDLSTYDKLMKIVRPGESARSKLIRQVKSKKMPPNDPLEAEQIERLTKWVDDGAEN